MHTAATAAPRTCARAAATAAPARLLCPSLRCAASAMAAHNTSSSEQHPLWARVLEVYESAGASGAATKTDTSVQTLDDGGITFVLRVVAALRAKPKGAVSAGDSKAAPRNPFLPPEEALAVQHLSDSHMLLLNKFNVVPHHVLVVTRAYESQADPLNSRDFAAAQQVLAAMPRGGVAFYNCGEHSGRSQPHKHLQVVPLPFVEEGHTEAAAGPAQPPIAHVVAAAQAAAGAGPLQPFPLSQLPYRAYAVALTPSSTSADELAAAAGQLLAACQSGLPAPVSYNVLLTREFLMYVPRRQEASGRVAINSLGFAGTILLKDEEGLAHAVAHTPLRILAEVGQPWDTTP